MKEYWFYLEPYTFFWEEDKKVLIFNSLSSEFLIIKKTDSIRFILDSWKNSGNTYVVTITDEELSIKGIKNLVQKVREGFSGDLIEKTLYPFKPLSLQPILNFQRAKRKLDNEKETYLGDNILNHLSELTIHLNGQCSQQCDECTKLNLQGLFCSKTVSELSIQKIELLFKSIGSKKTTLNILGGDIFSYQSLVDFINLVSQTNLKINYYFHYKNLLQNYSRIELFRKNYGCFHILVNFPIDKQIFKSLNNAMFNSALKFDWHFVITSDFEFHEVISLCNSLEITNYEIKPYFNCSNLSFFSKYVFINKKDIQNSKYNRRSIFANQTLNSNDFGKLLINSSGEIFANPHFKKLGTIDDDIRKLIYLEITQRESWLRIRDYEPCNSCFYQWLCPTPSNYELALGINNLCNIKEAKKVDITYNG